MSIRPFVYPGGIVDPNLFWDSENHLRNKNGHYPSPDCSTDFCTLEDVSRHKEAWHSRGGIYARWIDENGKEIDNRPFGWKKKSYGRMSCKPREVPPTLRPLTAAEAKEKIPLHAFI